MSDYQPSDSSQNLQPSGAKPAQEKKVKARSGGNGNTRQRLELAAQFAFSLFTAAFVLFGVWMASGLLSQRQPAAAASATVTPAPTASAPASLPEMTYIWPWYDDGISRQASLRTTIPDRAGFDVRKYEVVKGDTIFDIAEKYGLKPSTLLWGNQPILGDDPHNLRPGQELTILPTDGVYYQWHENDGMNGVAEYFGVKPEDIINWPGNHLSMENIGDLAKPNIAVGTWLIVPGGHREFISWSAPRISRENPAVAKVLGAGFCGTVSEGLVGNSTFVWPTTSRLISGFDYFPGANHPAIDIAGSLGNAVYATDAGVIVYAGWNDWGYGNVIVIDHGNGWQSLYAHLSSVNVGCAQSVSQGSLIGLVGTTGNSTGPHLHFELMYNGVKVNPHDYLQ